MKGEARVLVVGSELDVSSLPGMDQSQAPVSASVPLPPPPQGSALLWALPSPISTPTLA